MKLISLTIALLLLLVSCSGENPCRSGRHDFSPRYDECPIKIEEGFKMNAKRMTGEEVRALFIYNIYVCDICERCGKKIERPK